MKQAELEGVLRQHAQWLESRGQSGKQARLEQAQLQQCDLRGADLRYAVLTGARLTRAQLSNANLAFADLRNAELSYARCDHANLDGALISGATLEGADFEAATFQHASLAKANMRYARCQGANFASARIVETQMNHANLSHASFEQATLDEADLMHAILTGTQFEGATLIAVLAAPGALPEGASGPTLVRRRSSKSPEAQMQRMGQRTQGYLMKSVFYLTLPVTLLTFLAWLAMAVSDVSLMAVRSSVETQLGVPYTMLLGLSGAGIVLIIGQLIAAVLVGRLMPGPP